jgi:Cu2+-exporting ATPase
VTAVRAANDHIHRPHDMHNHATHAAHGGYAGHDHNQMVADFRKRFWASLLLTVPVLALSPMIQHALGLGENWRFSGDGYVLTALSSIIYFYGGWPFLDGLRQELRARNPGMMTLVGVAITAAYIYSVATLIGLAGNDFFWELVTLIDIMLLGHWIEMKSVMGAGKALEKLAALIPDTAHLLNSDGSTQEIAVSTLKGGEHLLVKPGEKIPADAIIIKGQTSANESMLTGESIPVPKQEGDTVIGGAINGEGAITVEVKHTGADSFLSGVIKLVQEAQASKSRTQDIANRAAFWLTVIALSVSALTAFSWMFFTEQGVAFAAANGLLIRDRTAFEEARRTQAIVFDKTGTLTKGEFGITDILVFDKTMKDDELVAYAASIDQHSENPIAKGSSRTPKKNGTWIISGPFPERVRKAS